MKMLEKAIQLQLWKKDILYPVYIYHFTRWSPDPEIDREGLQSSQIRALAN